MTRFVRRDAPRIWFAPDRPRPWYLIWAACAWAGVRPAASPEEAAAAFYFDDSTKAAAPRPPCDAHFNFGCADVSKSHVAAVFERVFGYPLAVESRAWSGSAVEKSEGNGTHDGRIVECPCEPSPGKAYQRLIETGDDRFVEDLRTPCVDGRPAVVWIKRKPISDRFSIHNSSVQAARPADVYSPSELEAIGRFCAAMGLDWGGLDILRERTTGRLYIVDVNKTDVGPVIALPWVAKLAATRTLAKALLALVSGQERFTATAPIAASLSTPQ